MSGSWLPRNSTCWTGSATATFRQDLYYRLDVLRLRIPPLRSRVEDIPALAAPLVADVLRASIPCHIDGNSLEVLMRHNWPGNVRELYHTLERAWLVGGGQITAELLANDLCAADEADDSPSPSDAMWSDPGRIAEGGGFRAAMDFAEKQLLVDALSTSGGNKTAAANALGMKPSTFRDKLAKHGLL